MGYAAVYVRGGVIHNVILGDNLYELKFDMIQSSGKVETSYDSLQIWDENRKIVFDYESDIKNKFNPILSCLSTIINNCEGMSVKECLDKLKSIDPYERKALIEVVKQNRVKDGYRKIIFKSLTNNLLWACEIYIKQEQEGTA